MTERELVRRFEAGALPADGFGHREHVRLAWALLREYPPAEALGRFSSGLRAFAEANGAAGLYHETITWAYLLLIRERMAAADPEVGWDEFAAANPDLLAWPGGALSDYYSDECLGSDAARAGFLFPDRVAR